VLENLTRGEIQRLSDVHKLQPRWPEPWIKSRTAGSDDHGLLNIGRTYTIFPDEVHTVDDLLNCLRDGRCRPSGEIGSSAKLAHAFYGIAIRYYTRHILSGRSPNLVTTILQTIVGERQAPTKWQWIKLGAKHKLKKLGRRVAAPVPADARAEVRHGKAQAAVPHLREEPHAEHPALRDVLKTGLPPLGEHDEMFRFVSSINRDVTRGIADAINNSIDDASFTGLFDSIGAGHRPAVRADALLLRRLPPEQGTAPAARDHAPAHEEDAAESSRRPVHRHARRRQRRRPVPARHGRPGAA
jgi:hypothetical protein